MISEQTIVGLKEDRPTMPIRELAEKHGVSVNTAQKHTLGIAGPKGSYKRGRPPKRNGATRFVGDSGKWSGLRAAIDALEARREELMREVAKIDKAIGALEAIG